MTTSTELSIKDAFDVPPEQRDIILSTINARYIHAAFGLRYLHSNLDAFAEQCEIVEFASDRKAIDMAEALLSRRPKIVGIGVYIWNAEASLELVSLLKRIDPKLIVVLGGPEVSFEAEEQAIVGLADYVIAGEGEWSFRELCERLLSGKKPLNKLISGRSPDLESLVSPYSLYTDEDIRQRVVYVEASVAAPSAARFCLSSLDKSVRNFPLDAFLEEMDSLYQRGLRHFKFVDRTFNLKIEFSRKILEFFLERYTPGLFLHFEMIPDRLPTELRELIARFPPGRALQFEVGVQSLNDDVSARISRRQDLGRMADNFAFLRDETGVHVHADLIVGLPGEDIGSFATGFERLRAMGAQEIQVGILKRLRGTPIARHDEEWEMVYSQHPPYEVLHTKASIFSKCRR